MAHIAVGVGPSHASPSLLRRLLSFFDLDFRRTDAIDELERLSDRDLTDIGIHRDDIGAIVDRELSRLPLSGLR